MTLPEVSRITALTTGRQDYGILRSTILLLRLTPGFELLLYAGGMHLSERFGRTIDLIRQDHVPVAREIPFLTEPPAPVADAASALDLVGAALASDAPQALLLVGDRYETVAAAVAATIVRVPIIHLHGGEETEGAADNLWRHAVTKLSNLHLVSHERHAERILQMGEDPRHVQVVGAPGLDNLLRHDLADRAELARELGVPLVHPIISVTVHPETRSNGSNLDVALAVAAALERVGGTCVITLPNADPGGVEIADFWKHWSAGRANVVVRGALGERLYWSLLKHAAALVGNSSSGLIEAPAARTPAVNVGDRQKNRLRSSYTVDVPADGPAIASALQRVLDPAFRRTRAGEPPLFAEGPAAPRVLAAIAHWLPERSRRKIFVDR